jgi:predicted ArsR family transcriptional regulator
MEQQDWKLAFVQKRYASLIRILEERLGEDQVREILAQMGSTCAADADKLLDQYQGNVEGYCAYVRQTPSGDTVTRDPKTGVITMTTDERADCFCPLVSVMHATPEVACSCSFGWQRHTWEKLLGVPVRVELTESVLKGGKRCTFEIRAGGGTAGT